MVWEGMGIGCNGLLHQSRRSQGKRGVYFSSGLLSISSSEKCKKQKLKNTLCFLYAFN